MPYVAIIKDEDNHKSKQLFDVSGADINNKIDAILFEYNLKNKTTFILEKVDCFAHGELEIKFPFVELDYSDLKSFYEETFNKDGKSPWETHGGVWKEIPIINDGLNSLYNLLIFNHQPIKPKRKK